MVPQSSSLPSSLLSKKIPIDCYFITLLTGATTEITVNSCNEKQLEKKIESLKANTTYLVTVHASVRRTRDNSSLYGEKTKTYFTTGLYEFFYFLLINRGAVLFISTLFLERGSFI